MPTITEALEERRQSIIQLATAVAQRGVAENRRLTGEEQSEFDKMIGEAEKIGARIQELKEGEARAHDLELSFRSVTGRDLPMYRSEGAFAKFLREARGVDSFDMNRVDGAERRAIAEYQAGRTEERAVSATGGLGPDGVYGTMWEYAIAGSEILQAGVTMITTADGNTIPLPRATAHSVAAATAANAVITQSDPTFDTVPLSTSKYAYLTLVPNELLQDATFDIEGYFARAAGRELSKVVGNVAGTAAVAGFTTAGASIASASVATALADGLVDLWHSVLPEYRMGAAFLANDATYASARKAKTSGSGEYIWQTSLAADKPDTILGRRPYIHPALDSVGAAKKPVYFGDWSALAVRIAGGIRFERSTEYAFDKDQTAFRAIVRTGAAVTDPNAVKYLATT